MFGVLAILAAFLVTKAENQIQVEIGIKTPDTNARLLKVQTVKIHQGKSAQVMEYEKTFSVDSPSIISEVRLINQNLNKDGVTAKIINGGPGNDIFTVRFISEKGQSIDYKVEIAGR
ncbi:hypothetical protein QAD02_011544 [Eretmocerus hayati]|uniref:Uncharacterized protein n=1 Tax=Eretmocerus hayati TaxID=131215 RepID=A0ACC2NX16_9HYME|nr:hypothetical protein QAD02_011544 [Eretmocerus hayati]